VKSRLLKTPMGYVKTQHDAHDHLVQMKEVFDQLTRKQREPEHHALHALMVGMIALLDEGEQHAYTEDPFLTPIEEDEEPTMKLHVLFFQRNESYDGEYAPEALAVVDEYTNEESPEWFIEKQKQEKEKLEGEGVFKVIDIKVSQEQIRELLVGVPEIEGEVDSD